MATRFERFVGSLLLAAVGLATCGKGQAPKAFPRNAHGHRYLSATQGVAFGDGVQAQLVALLQGPQFTGKFLCARGVPSDSGLTLTGLDAADLSTVPICADSVYVGGVTLAGASIAPFTPEEFRRVAAILESRRDFLFLALADSVFLDAESGIPTPRMWWFVATDKLLDTELPPPDGAERQL